MPAIESGRVCVVTAGRRAGQRVVITKLFRQGFVQAKGLDKKAKERKYSVQHLEPTKETMDVEKKESIS